MFSKRLDELYKLLSKAEYSSPQKQLSESGAILAFHSLLRQTEESDGTVFVIGNGGSAGIASHFAIDLLNALKIAAQTLYDSNTLTCISNDYGYEEVFSRPLKLLLKPDDLLICISSSGNSQNILAAAQVAIEKDIPLITLSGFHPKNPLRSMGGLNFYLPIEDYGIVEMGHLFLLHTIIDSWKQISDAPIKTPSLSYAE